MPATHPSVDKLRDGDLLWPIAATQRLFFAAERGMVPPSPQPAQQATQWLSRTYDWTEPLHDLETFYCSKLCYAAFQSVSQGQALRRPAPALWPLASYWLTPAELLACAGLAPVP
jgi:hypothetical protein